MSLPIRKVGLQWHTISLCFSRDLTGMSKGNQVIACGMYQQDGNGMFSQRGLYPTLAFRFPASETFVSTCHKAVAKAHAEDDNTGRDNSPGNRGQYIEHLAQLRLPPITHLRQLIANDALQHFIRARKGTISNNSNDIRMWGREECDRGTHRETLQDDSPRQCLRLSSSSHNGGLKIMHLSIATARHDALTPPMPTKIEEQNIISAGIFYRRSRTQMRTINTVAMT